MLLFWIIVIAAVLLLAALLAAFVCYRMAFYVPPRTGAVSDVIDLPDGEIYEPFREVMTQWTKEVREMPHQEFSVQSFDGLKLYGKYYEYKPGAPIELMFHG